MKREKNDKFPKWRKTSSGTLVLRKPSTVRVKPKQEIRCPVGELGRFAISDFELLDSGKGEFKVDKEIIKKSVADAEKVRIRGNDNKRRHREVIKQKDLVPTVPVVGEVSEKESKGDEEYKVKHKGGGKYVVLSSSGKRMNEEFLDKAEAKKLKKQLEV